MPICRVVAPFTVATADGQCWWYGVGQYSFSASDAFSQWWQAHFDGAPIMDDTPLDDPGPGPVLSRVPPPWWQPWTPGASGNADPNVGAYPQSPPASAWRYAGTRLPDDAPEPPWLHAQRGRRTV
jgi:hypothetical protein